MSNTSSSARSHTARASSLSSSRGAIRGGSSLGLKNIFSSRGPAKKRRNIIENSADPLKDPKHYANMHTLRKAELAGRGVADSAPDVSALGGLYRPSDPSTFLSLKTARHAAPSTESKQQDSYLEGSQMDIE
jgi:chromo domain-containing protein 1